jgi:membrane protease YdiL (CAAX protease family)
VDTVQSTRRPPLAVRVVLVLVAAWLIWTFVIHGLAPLLGMDPHADRTGHAVRAVLTALLAVPVVLLARRYLDRRPLAGLGLEHPGRGLALGAGLWVVLAALGTAVTLGLGWATVTTGPFPASTALLALYLPVLVLLYEALPEELLFRGYLYRNLATAVPRWAAVVGQAALFALFGALVGAAGSVPRLLMFFGFGLVLGALRVVTGSVWAPIGFHLVFQYVAQYLGAAGRDGAVVVDGRENLELVALGLFPLGLGWIVLAVVAGRRGVAWRERVPDPA